MFYNIAFFIFFCIPIFGAESIQKIYDYISKAPLAVLSTMGECHDGPESALIAFAQNEDLELYFMTFADSRKYANLQRNPSVSLVIGFECKTIQYEGAACELRETAIEEALYAFSLKQTPCSSDYLHDSRARFFKIKPKWVRYSDYTIYPAEIFERRFVSGLVIQ